MKYRTRAAILLIVSSLAGCTTEAPVPGNSTSIVHLEAQVGDEMIARRIDTKPAPSLSHFKVSAGEHTMEVGIVAKGYQKSQRRCVATLAYGGFQPNETYRLIESRSGMDVKVTLFDNKGVALAETDNVPCL
ncbi:hypothetical protein [Pseudomonas syringae]|uniref:PA0061/PA0062 family lipoprotein n=1 Tax=Pseudomonas syringae TaxID=317 RepID=UPI001EFB61E3|nr:hypothetical protein [Pseudomonas syringae]